MICDKLKKLVDGTEGRDKTIFRSYPHMIFDNYFSGDKVMDYVGSQGFGCLMTCRRDRLPGDCDGSHQQRKWKLMT